MNLTKLLVLNRLSIGKANREISAACTRLMSGGGVKEAPVEATGIRNSAKSRLKSSSKSEVPANYRHIFPEFLPDPNLLYRHSLREKVERCDMLDRRSKVDIPEFYVGSILAITRNDRHASGKSGRFVGICIDRQGAGLRANIILRNCIDHQGIEVTYDLYDPTIQKIEVLRLEKRLDDRLFYLRDALPEYSTFDAKMETIVHPEGEPIPVNPIKVELKPRPWRERYERQNLQGISNLLEHVNERYMRKVNHPQNVRAWEKYDLMREYRATIPAEEQAQIYGDIYPQLSKLHTKRKKVVRQSSRGNRN